MRLQFEGPAGPIDLDIEHHDGAFSVLLPNGDRKMVRAERGSGDILLLEIDGHMLHIPFARSEDVVEFSHAGEVYSFTPLIPSRSIAVRQHSSGELRAPMVGTVTNVFVQNGVEVESYQPILVIEAMKVLATLEAPFAGIVDLRVNKGQQVQHGQILAEVMPTDEATLPGDS